jgi:hypothetical protein
MKKISLGLGLVLASQAGLLAYSGTPTHGGLTAAARFVVL